jgi:hypothetical protein
MTTGWKAAVVLLAQIALAPVAYAQTEESRRPIVWDIARAVLIDPTTYVPAVVTYEAMLQDWKTSQALFSHGWVEGNPRFTISGRPNDVPVGYDTGKRIIRNIGLELLQQSVVHNVAVGVVDRLLIARYPERKKLIRTLSWIERIGFASAVTYLNSAKHFRQAGTNRRLIGEHYGP